MYGYEYEFDFLLCLRLLKFLHMQSPEAAKRVVEIYKELDTEEIGIVMEEILWEYSHRVTIGGGDELTRLADEFNELTIVYFSHRDIDRLYELGRQESARHGKISDSWRRKIQDISEFFATGPTYSIFGFSHHFSTRGVVFEAKLSPDCYEPILFGNTLIDMVLYCQRDLRRLEARMEKEKVIELEAERKEAA